MRAARDIVISASAKVSAAQPWFQLHIIPLVTGLSRDRIRAMSYRAPCSSLNRAPEQDISFAAPQTKNINVVAANGRDVDRLVVLSAHRERPGICLEHIPAIAIIGREEAPFTFPNRSMDLRPGSIDHLDVQFP